MADVLEDRTTMRPCPECGELTEPEQDGDHRYFDCQDCGVEFGYSRMETTVLDADGHSCSAGVPDEIRKAFSRPPEPEKPLIQIGRRN